MFHWRLCLGPLVLTCLGVWVGPAGVRAQDPSAPPEESTAAPSEASEPEVPASAAETEQVGIEQAIERAEPETEEVFPRGFWIEFGDDEDWLRLTSGEWLQGELKWMREKDFEFDSDKMDLVRKAWSKVDQLHSPNIKTYVFRDKVYATGRGMVTRDRVIVQTDEGIKTFPRSELLSILEGGIRELDWWSMELGASFSATTGNSDQGSLSVSFGVTRADQRTATEFGYEGTFGYANKEQNVSRHIGGIVVTFFINERFYVIPFGAELFHDRFANIRFRATPAALGGIHLFDTKKVEWDFEYGLGYQYLQFESAAAGVENPQSDGFVPLRTFWDFDITGDVELELEWVSNVVFTAIGNTNHSARALFTVEVTDIFDFETEFQFFRTENPVPRADGSVPESNDYQLKVGFTVNLG